MRKSTRAIAIAAATLAFVGMGSAAYAYWEVTGQGEGNAKVSTQAVSVLVAVQDTVIKDLAPGSGPQWFGGHIENTGNGPGYVQSITVSITRVIIPAKSMVVAGGVVVCDASDFILSGATMNVNADKRGQVVGVDVPANSSAGFWGGATIEFNNKDGVNQDYCKGAEVQVAYTLS